MKIINWKCFGVSTEIRYWAEYFITVYNKNSVLLEKYYEDNLNAQSYYLHVSKYDCEVFSVYNDWLFLIPQNNAISAKISDFLFVCTT